MPNAVRISRNSAHAIIEDNGVYSKIDTDTNDVIETADDLSSLVASGGWRIPSRDDINALTADSSFRRAKSARDQPRDRYGRWLAEGAFVKWVTNGKNFSGVVDSIKNGRAYITVKDSKGVISNTSLDLDFLNVITSKARLGENTENDITTDKPFKESVLSPQVKAQIKKNGLARVKHSDGSSVEIKKNDKDEKNPFIYQLYAANGKSLGSYGKKGVKNLDKINNDNSGIQASAEDEFTVIEEVDPKPYRVPEGVKDLIAAYLANIDEGVLSEDDYNTAMRLASDPSVSGSDVFWIANYFAGNEESDILHGGYAAQKWANKIRKENSDDDAPADEYTIFNDDDNQFYGEGPSENPEATGLENLFYVDFETEDLFIWKTGEGFIPASQGKYTELEAPYIIPLDAGTAKEFAKFIDGLTVDDYESEEKPPLFYPEEVNPEERVLAENAVSELDEEELAIVAALIADGVYTPAERSENAKVQPRGAGGRFGGGGPKDGPVARKDVDTGQPQSAPKVKKAQLEVELPLIDDPKQYIEDWLEVAPVTAAADTDEADQAVADSTLYFAIVDPVDKQAVLDLVAINKAASGKAQAWLRADARWIDSPDTLAQLQGMSPPPVVKIDTPDPAKSVIAQIDEYDKESGKSDEPKTTDSSEIQTSVSDVDTTGVTATAYTEKQRETDAKKGYAMPSGAYPIRTVSDLKNAVQAYGRAKESEKAAVKKHIKKRAKALNRMDLIPENWRSFSMIDEAEATANSSDFFDEYGAIVAAGHKGHRGDAAKLREYWTHGLGAAKIRWGTDGDLSRAHKHLAKYFPQNAWGLVQNYHKYLFGMSNYKRDHK